MTSVSNLLVALERQQSELKNIEKELADLRKHDMLLRSTRPTNNYHTVEDLYRLVQTRDDVRHTLRNIDAPTQSQQVCSKDEQLTMQLWSEVSTIRLERQAKEVVVLYLKQNFTLQ